MSDENDKDPVYFNYYGQLQHQQNMLEDDIRTRAYYDAITKNKASFAGKVVLDVGAGSGILSFFAAQAGAKRVYAVEASNMAQNAEALVRANGLESVIKVIKGKIEDVELGEKVDVVISEPMGVMLFHERMIESYLWARDRFLKPECRGALDSMFPAYGTIYLAPFTDSATHTDLRNRSKFWKTADFYGVDLSSMAEVAVDQIFSQPVVGGFDPHTLMCKMDSHSFSFCDDSIEALHDIKIEFNFTSLFTGIIHGLAGWFDVEFCGREVRICLDTSAYKDRTHWQQCRFFFRHPLAINAGQVFRGCLRMRVNSQRSYDVEIEGGIIGCDVKLASENYNLQDQQYFNLSPAAYPEISPELYGLYQ